MIARIWRGAVETADGDEYAAYIGGTGMAEYAAVPGNRGAWMLRREVGELTEFVTISHWDDVEAIKAFAGDDHERAKFYPADDRFLVERDEMVRHYTIV